MVSRLYLDPILTGWVAFALSVVLFLLVIAWYFKSEADKARHELVSSKIYNSETASLITRRNIRRLNSSVMTQYHQICSDDEIEEEDELDVNPKPLVPQPPSHRFHFRSTTSRRSVARWPPNYSKMPESDIPKYVTRGENIPRRHTRRLLDASELSEGSDSTYASSRPLSYRDIRQSAKNTPIVVSVLADV